MAPRSQAAEPLSNMFKMRIFSTLGRLRFDRMLPCSSQPLLPSPCPMLGLCPAWLHDCRTVLMVWPPPSMRCRRCDAIFGNTRVSKIPYVQDVTGNDGHRIMTTNGRDAMAGSRKSSRARSEDGPPFADHCGVSVRVGRSTSPVSQRSWLHRVLTAQRVNPLSPMADCF
jgi:hypothetical protein